MLEIIPYFGVESSTTSHTTIITTRYNIFSRKSYLFSLSRSNTPSIRKSLSSSERPTRPTISLVSDFFNRITFAPYFSRIKIFRNNIRSIIISYILLFFRVFFGMFFYLFLSIFSSFSPTFEFIGLLLSKSMIPGLTFISNPRIKFISIDFFWRYR